MQLASLSAVLPNFIFFFLILRSGFPIFVIQTFKKCKISKLIYKSTHLILAFNFAEAILKYILHNIDKSVNSKI